LLTDQQIARALRYGIRSDGEALFDFMPFHNASDEDLTAIISYLRQQKPVAFSVPKNELNLVGKAVKAFALKPAGPTETIPRSVNRDTTAAYGKYLTGSIANCRGCHTNRNMMTGEFIGPDFAGGLKFEVEADTAKLFLTTPNLTPDNTGRIKDWTLEQFIARFRKGALIPGTHMPWKQFGRMSDDELKAIYNYLQTIKPVHNVVPAGYTRE